MYLVVQALVLGNELVPTSLLSSTLTRLTSLLMGKAEKSRST